MRGQKEKLRIKKKKGPSHVFWGEPWNFFSLFLLSPAGNCSLRHSGHSAIYERS